jgi:hypothetical protein
VATACANSVENMWWNPLGIIPGWWWIAALLLALEVAIVVYMERALKLQVGPQPISADEHWRAPTRRGERSVANRRLLQVGTPTYVALIALALVFAPAFKEHDVERVCHPPLHFHPPLTHALPVWRGVHGSQQSTRERRREG